MIKTKVLIATSLVLLLTGCAVSDGKSSDVVIPNVQNNSQQVTSEETVSHDIVYAEYLIANRTSERIVIDRKTTKEVNGITRRTDRIAPDNMDGIVSVSVKREEDTKPSSIFSDMTIFASETSEDIIYTGVEDDDWISIPSLEPNRKRYALFIGPKVEVVSSDDCSRLYY